MELYSSAMIPSLQMQMQWLCGMPQVSANSRIMYDFNNDSNVIQKILNPLSGIQESGTAQQEATICNPETGKFALFYNGENVFDGFFNKVNDTPFYTQDHTFLTSVIAPSPTNNRRFHIFYSEKNTHSLNYSLVEYTNGFDMPAQWIGHVQLDSLSATTPLGLACQHEGRYWLLAYDNAQSLRAYLFSNNDDNGSIRHIALQPFTSIAGAIDCKNSSIVTHGNKIALTVNNQIMIGTLDFSDGIAINNQAIVDTKTLTLMPAFNRDGNKLYYLKEPSASSQDHVFVYENGSSYSPSSYTFTEKYVTLKLGPDGNIYGTNAFVQVDPLLQLIEVNDKVEIKEIINDPTNSSTTFGNNQYQINNL